MILRPYQADIIERVRAEYRRGARAVLMQMPTGAGKTATAAECIRASVAKGRRVIFAAHLDSLLTDTSRRLEAAGVEHGIVQASRPSNPSAPVQVASLATLHRRPDCRPPADLIILDECRRAAAPTVRGVLEAYPDADLLGLDATPERGDGTALGDIFEAMVCGPSVKWLTDGGYLVPAIVLSPPQPVDGALAMDPVEAYERHGEGRRAIFFCRDVEDARDVAHRLPCHARVVTGETGWREREEIRALLASGELRALVNVDVYRDGADLPSLECVVVARTMGVASAFLQACGRGLRAADGKRDCLILDLSGAAVLHGLPSDDRVWSLDGAAVRRVGDDLKLALSRCAKCFAIFHAGPRECPRCGAHLSGGRVKRRATRIERQELARLDDRPQEVRDRIAIAGIEKRLRASGRFTEAQIPRIAQSIFRKKRGRAAEEAKSA